MAWTKIWDWLTGHKANQPALSIPQQPSTAAAHADGTFDVFLSHNSKDKPMVRSLAQALTARGIAVWLDEEQLQPGRPWQDALETIIQKTRTAAVLIGKDGLGPWEKPEMRACLSQFVERGLSVIPVLLPDALAKPELPLFLQEFTWVDLRGGLTDKGLDRLEWGITGFKPSQTDSVLKTESVLPQHPLREPYLRQMHSEWRALPLEVMDPSAADPAAQRLTLEKVYVSLDTTSPRPDKLKQNRPDEQKDQPLSAVEALTNAQDRRMVLLGQPGSGKSTLGLYLCASLAEGLINPVEAGLSQGLPGWNGKALLPVFVSLRRFASSLSSHQTGSCNEIEAFICHQLDERDKLQGFGRSLLDELSGRGGMVVFDGLDEVSADCRAVVKASLVAFANQYPRCLILATCRVYSYRQEADWRLPWEDHTLAEFNRDKIRAFIDGWYGALKLLNPTSPIDYCGKAQTLKSVLDPDDPRGLLELAGTPLLLTVMAIVHAHKELPDSRVGVYRDCVNILLIRWQGAREGDVKRPPLLNALSPHHVTEQKLQQGLKEIAYKAHESGDKRGSGNRALVSRDIITAVMHKWLGPQGLEVFLDYCRHANGLLLTERVVQLEEGVTDAWYVFPHLSFEEYLAAMYWLQQKNNGLDLAVERAGDPAWWEVSRFYGEHLCHDEQGANTHLAKALLEKLCKSYHRPHAGEVSNKPLSPEGRGVGERGSRVLMDDADWRRVWLAGALLPGWCKETPEEDQDEALIQRITGRLVDLLNTEAALRDDMPARAAAGRVLATIGDPRLGVTFCNPLPTGEGRERADNAMPDFLWVRIPGTAQVIASGKFTRFDGLRLGLGAKSDPQAYSDENWPENKAALHVRAFDIAAYPVTVDQFRPFVEQGCYRDNQFWSEAGRRARDENGWKEPRYWDDRVWTLPNHPVVGVSWYESEAYCNWLNASLPTNQSVRLPTEAEWEWVARGPEGRIYPWGDSWKACRCNSGESGLSRTTAVGCFPGGVADWWRVFDETSSGVHDLSGNVWEWTASEWSEDYALAESIAINEPSDRPRVLRGGAWSYVPRYVRGSNRFRNTPQDGNSNRGFRLVRTFSL